MKLSLIPVISGILLLTSFTAQSEIIFKDTFESGDFQTTNADGFEWEATNLTSIATKDATINNGSPTYNPIKPGFNWDSRKPEFSGEDVGEHVMRFRYHAGEEWTEQRYDMGGAYKDLWVSYWIRVPINYTRPNGTNNKWFNIWMGRSKNKHSSDYENSNISRIEMQDWPGSNNSMDINIQFRNGTDGKYKNSTRYSNFVTPADAGRWMKVVYRFKASSNNSANDGILQMYRRWHGQENYELINDLQNINVGVGSGSIAAGRPGWGAGYIMGYANAAYRQETDWLIDDFTTSTHNLLGSVEITSSPMPPPNLTVRVANN